ncbi:hypothetical protein BX616_001201, partial [Lobosporangium transversale]
MAWNSSKSFAGFSDFNTTPKDKDMDVDVDTESSPVPSLTASKKKPFISTTFDDAAETFQETFETGIEFQKFARPLEKLQRLRIGSSLEADIDMVAILPEFDILCSTRAQQLEYRKDSDAGYRTFSAVDEYKLWQSESHTWLLLTILFNTFEKKTAYVGKGSEVLEWSDLDLIEHLANMDNNYKHHLAVKTWLETIAPEFTPIALAKTYAQQTNNTFSRPTLAFGAPRTHSATSPLSKKVYIDPDATTRDGTKLGEGNQRAEQDLLRTVWEYIRRGNVEDAKRACIKANEHWRAESIGGGSFYSVPIAFKDPVYDREDDRHGNKTRSLWKGTCYALATEPTVDKYERAIYGALCGDVSSVLPVCTSWEDHAWAQYNALVESMNEARLGQFNRGGASKALPLPASTVTSAKDIFNNLMNSDNQEVKNASQETFRRVQMSIILGQTDQLLVKMAKEAQASSKNGSPIQPHLLRFMAHFVLLLQSKEAHVPKDAGNYFIKSYVDYLISRKMYDLAPLYASFLPVQLQVEACSSYLITINGSKKDRQEHVNIIRRNRLDMHKILTATVDALLENIKDDLERRDVDYMANLQWSIESSSTTEEKTAIKAMEWLTFDEHQYQECLLRSNSLARRYLLQGRLNAALALFNSLPAEVGQLQFRELQSQQPQGSQDTVIQSNTHEHFYYRDLFSTRLLYEEWKDHLTSKPTTGEGQRSKMMMWESTLK